MLGALRLTGIYRYSTRALILEKAGPQEFSIATGRRFTNVIFRQYRQLSPSPSPIWPDCQTVSPGFTKN